MHYVMPSLSNIKTKKTNLRRNGIAFSHAYSKAMVRVIVKVNLVDVFVKVVIIIINSPLFFHSHQGYNNFCMTLHSHGLKNMTCDVCTK